MEELSNPAHGGIEVRKVAGYRSTKLVWLTYRMFVDNAFFETNVPDGVHNAFDSER